MKQFIVVFAAFVASASYAQDVSAIPNQIGDPYSAATNQLKDASKKIDSLLSVGKKPLVVDYTKTYRYSLAENAYKFGSLPVGVVTSIAPAKGTAKLNYAGTKTPTLGMPYITKDGLLFLQNQLNTYYIANISVYPKYPNEMWYVWYKPDYFIYEKYAEDPFYTGDYGSPTSFRLTNANTPDQMFINAVTPVNKPSIFRIRTTKIGNKTDYVNVELWIDGVKQTNEVQVTAWYRNYFAIGVGVNTNNAYVGWAEVFNTPVLSDYQALRITQELQAEYKPYGLPIATDLKYMFSGGNITVSYKYNGRLPEGKAAKIRWVEMNGGPDKSRYRSEYDNKSIIPVPFSGRAEITVYDVNGHYFDIPSTKLAR